MKKLLIATIVGIVLYSTYSCLSAPNEEDVLVTISRETTYITQPLNARGYPDYIEALNQELSQGVTKDNNAVVLLYQLSGPGKQSPAEAKEYAAKLGVDRLPEEGLYFQPWEKYVEALPEDQLLSVAKEEIKSEFFSKKDYRLDKTKEILNPCVNAPWVSQDAPLVAAWLKKHQFVFDRLPELERRTRFYSPYVTDQEPELLINCNSPDIEISEIQNLIVSRINLALGEGDIDTAKKYLLLALKLANSYQQGITIVDQLISSALFEMVLPSAAQVMLHEKFTKNDLTAFDKYFKLEFKECNFAKMYELYSRYQYLNAVCAMAEYGPDAFQGGLNVKRQPVSERNTVNYDAMLKHGNQMIDEYLTSLQPNPEKKFDFTAFDKKYFSAPDKLGTWDKVSGFLFKQSRTKQTQDKLVQIVQFDLNARGITRYKSELYSGFYRILIALRRYHNLHGRYPLKLSDLPADIVAIIPMERYSDNQVTYRSNGKGFLLYSLWDDKDSGGYNDKDHDDFSIYTPDFKPQRPPPKEPDQAEPEPEQ